MSDDPAVRAAIEARTYHRLVNERDFACECGKTFDHDWLYDQHVMAVAVEAARPIIRAEYEAQIGGERLVHRLQEIRLREEVGLRPRWEDDPIVIANGWIEGRCAGCGDPLPRAAVRTEPERLENVNLADSQQWDTKRFTYAETPDSSIPRFPEPENPADVPWGRIAQEGDDGG